MGGLLSVLAWLGMEFYDASKQKKKTEQDRIESAERKASFGSKMSEDRKFAMEIIKNMRL